jgi:hypothetical protein
VQGEAGLAKTIQVSIILNVPFFSAFTRVVCTLVLFGTFFLSVFTLF